MVKELFHISQKGFSLVEVLLGVAVFSLFVTAVVGGIIYGRESIALSGTRQRAIHLADECQEAIRGIRDGNYANLINGTYGLSLIGGHWILSGLSDITDGFTRTANITDGVANQKIITCNVNWQQTLQRTGNVQTISYLTNWKVAVANKRGGMLVYGDGGTTTDSIKYRSIDNTGAWGSALATADIDAGTTNKALRAVQLYSKPSSNEKIMVSRHYDGTRQYIYAQVWNGTSWGNVIHLTSATNGWVAGTFLDVQNFSGTYLNNGNFMVVYSDGTATPKYNTWNGTAWGVAAGTQAVTTAPVYLIAKAQPGANNVMLAIQDQGNRSVSTYWNGTTWSALVVHSVAMPTNTTRQIDFDWSPSSPAKGAIIYPASATARAVTLKIFDQPSTTWSAAGSGTNKGAGSTRNSTAQVVGRVGVGLNTFTACEQVTTPTISCYNVVPNAVIATAPTITDAGTYPNVASATDTAIQKPFDFGYELSGTIGIITYSDNTAIAKYKIFTPGTPGSFGLVQTLGTTTSSPVKTARVKSNNLDDDLFLSVTDNSRSLFTAFWNSAGSAIYASGGRSFQVQGVNGSAITDYWYDFAWDTQ